MWKKIGAEGLALWRRTEALIENIEQNTGRMRPDLSLVPTMAETKYSAK